MLEYCISVVKGTVRQKPMLSISNAQPPASLKDPSEKFVACAFAEDGRCSQLEFVVFTMDSNSNPVSK